MLDASGVMLIGVPSVSVRIPCRATVGSDMPGWMTSAGTGAVFQFCAEESPRVGLHEVVKNYGKRGRVARARPGQRRTAGMSELEKWRRGARNGVIGEAVIASR